MSLVSDSVPRAKDCGPRRAMIGTTVVIATHGPLKTPSHLKCNSEPKPDRLELVQVPKANITA